MSISHGPKTVDAVVRLLELAWTRAGVPLICELCSNPTWSVVHDGNHDGVGLPLRAGTSHLPFSPNYLVYAAECKQCGNVRLHGKDAVERLAAEQQQLLLNQQEQPLGALFEDD